MRDTASETLALPLEDAASPFSSPNNQSPITNNSSSALAVKYSTKNRRCEAASSYLIQNLEQDAPRTAWNKMFQLR
jgi:hypothetical protein